MSVSNQETQFPYVGNGVTVTFPYNCQVQKAVDLDVYLAGVQVNSGYTINGVGSLTGGSVTFNLAPAAGVAVFLERVVELERTTDYQQNGDFLSRVVNPDFDRIWMALQQFSANIFRALRFPKSDVNPVTELPVAAQRANKVLGFDAAGNPIVVIPVSGSADEVAIELANFRISLSLPSYAALRAYAGDADYVEIYTEGIAGKFTRVLSGVDDGGVTFVAANGTRWHRIYTGPADIRWWGAKFDSDITGTSGTDDTAAVQACLTYAVPLQKTIILPGGFSKITSQITMDVSSYGLNMVGQGYQRTRFKYPTLGAGASLFRFTGYPGGLCGAVISGIGFDGNAGTNAFSLSGNTGQIIKNCQFGANAFALQLANNAVGVFTEFNILRDCDFLLSCQSAIWYLQSGSGDASFHGSGIEGGTINNSGVQSVLVLSPAANPYNAPFSPTIFVHANVTIISYGAPLTIYRPNFFGTLKLEVQAGRALICDAPPGRAIAYAGNVASQSANVEFGGFFMCNGIFSAQDGTRQTIGARIGRLNNLTTGSTTLPVVPYGIMEGCALIAVHVVAANYDYRLLYSSWGVTTGGSIQLMSTYSNFNVAAYGPPVVSLNSQGQIVITNPNYPATGVVSLIDIQQIGQSPSSGFIP